LIRWPQPITEYIGFIGSLLPAGAIGFRYAVIRGALARGERSGVDATRRRVYADTARRAAVIGLIGTTVAIALMLYQLPGLAARRHTSVSQLITHTASVEIQGGFLILALIGFLLALRSTNAGWVLATIGFLAALLRNGLLGQWSELPNPLHVLAAGLWIGTLFVMIVAGISVVMRNEVARDQRGAIVSDMVYSFSPLALTAAPVLVLFGVIIAWEHLHVLSNLWASAYGVALLVKLVFVAAVFGLGAWNWRRQKPTLGTEGAAIAIRRSATSEVAVAALVLAATAVLLSIPAPRPPGARPPGASPAGEQTEGAPAAGTQSATPRAPR
jgi:putative copper export protein